MRMVHRQQLMLVPTFIPEPVIEVLEIRTLLQRLARLDKNTPSDASRGLKYLLNRQHRAAAQIGNLASSLTFLQNPNGLCFRNSRLHAFLSLKQTPFW